MNREIEFEASQAKSLLIAFQNEAEAKLRLAQEKNDELMARLMTVNQEHKALKTSSKRIAEEHGQYEAIIRNVGGLTTSQALDKVNELAATCIAYRDEYGLELPELREQVDNLLRVGNTYEILAARRPQLKELFAPDVGASLRSTAITSSRPRSGSRMIEPHPREIFQEERRMVERRGRSRGLQSTRDRGFSSSRGRIDINSIMSASSSSGRDFVDEWLSFSGRGRSLPSSSRRRR